MTAMLAKFHIVSNRVFGLPVLQIGPHCLWPRYYKARIVAEPTQQIGKLIRRTELKNFKVRCIIRFGRPNLLDGAWRLRCRPSCFGSTTHRVIQLGLPDACGPLVIDTGKGSRIHD